MSSATETVTRTRTARTVLTDYELHHSGAAGDDAASSSSSTQGSASSAPQNPPNWPTTSRRVPPYRPANVDRDQSEVRVYTHPAERAFIVTMFTGVFLTAVSNNQRQARGRGTSVVGERG